MSSSLLWDSYPVRVVVEDATGAVGGVREGVGEKVEHVAVAAEDAAVCRRSQKCRDRRSSSTHKIIVPNGSQWMIPTAMMRTTAKN